MRSYVSALRLQFAEGSEDQGQAPGGMELPPPPGGPFSWGVASDEYIAAGERWSPRPFLVGVRDSSAVPEATFITACFAAGNWARLMDEGPGVAAAGFIGRAVNLASASRSELITAARFPRVSSAEGARFIDGIQGAANPDQALCRFLTGAGSACVRACGRFSIIHHHCRRRGAAGAGRMRDPPRERRRRRRWRRPEPQRAGRRRQHGERRGGLPAAFLAPARVRPAAQEPHAALHRAHPGNTRRRAQGCRG